MNRRDFAKSLAALGLVPALPALPAAAATSAPAYTPYMYGLGAHLARTLGHCSPELLSAKLGLGPAAAQAMQAQLTRAGIVGATQTGGLALAAQPYMQTGSTTASVLSTQARRAARKLAQTALETPDDITDETQPRT